VRPVEAFVERVRRADDEVHPLQQPLLHALDEGLLHPRPLAEVVHAVVNHPAGRELADHVADVRGCGDDGVILEVAFGERLADVREERATVPGGEPGGRMEGRHEGDADGRLRAVSRAVAVGPRGPGGLAAQAEHPGDFPQAAARVVERQLRLAQADRVDPDRRVFCREDAENVLTT
jgi:hypothetical protein